MFTADHYANALTHDFTMPSVRNSVLFASASMVLDIALVPTFVLAPLTYLGGVFYSVRMLPELWQGVSHANPILYMVNAFRFGMLGVSDVSLWVAYAVMGGLALVLAMAALWLLRRGIGLRS